MMLQNEATDANEDLEHFEDIPDIDDNKTGNDSVSDEDNGDARSHANCSSGDSDDDVNIPVHDSGEDSFSDTDDLLGDNHLDKIEESNPISDQKIRSIQSRMLPGGYDPRHREPSYCHADRVGWWELTVLAQHVHPSVAAMASTLLSGVNIVYNGNPLTDLSLSAFLDKFMEKKPKQSTWHGASQIEPAKKMDMNHQLIGAEILKLAESDVPPEDVVFHKFYMNKMNSSKKPKRKKKTAEDEAAEELYAVDGDEDESDNEEIENILDSADPSLEADGEYDYDDLDKMDNKDDGDLVLDASDEEIDLLSDVDSEMIDESNDDDVSEDDNIEIGEADDGSDFEDSFDQKMIGEADDDGGDFEDSFDRKRKNKRKSPFASLEKYQHMINEDEDPTSKHLAKQKRKQKSRKKKRKTSGEPF